MSFAFSNNAVTLLTAPLSSVDTVFVVGTGEGDKFPSPTGGDIAKLVIEDRKTGEREILNCTSRSGDQFNVTRGREGTNAISWETGAILSHRATAEIYDSFAAYESDISALQASVSALQDTVNELDAQTRIPINGLHFSSNNQNPATTLGYGTWEAYAKGRAIVGVGDNGLTNWVAGNRGQDAEFLTTNMIPGHTHTVEAEVGDDYPDHTHWISATIGGGGHSHTVKANGGSAGSNRNLGPTQDNNTFQNLAVDGDGSHTHDLNFGTLPTSNRHRHYLSTTTGAAWTFDTAYPTIQASIGVYIWRRTA